jgi:hypothetical protein
MACRPLEFTRQRGWPWTIARQKNVQNARRWHSAVVLKLVLVLVLVLVLHTERCVGGSAAAHLQSPGV